MRVATTAALFLVACCACGPSRMPLTPSNLGQVPASASAQAGVAEVDITPPPGLSLFGHGPEARIAEGTLLRLRCHAFVLVGAQQTGERRSPAGGAIAWIPCELPAPTLLLQREVARRLAELHVPLGAESIALSATHTHAGPAHYLPFENWSGPMSGRRLGYDEEVVAFLSTRIAQAVHEAYKTLAPARWGWTTRAVYGLSRNRSYAAFVKNSTPPPELSALLAAAGEDPASRAVDPQLSLLRIDTDALDGTGYHPRAALLVFGLHPTVIDHEQTMYGGDVFGYATRALSDALRERHQVPVLVAMANGIEGDVTPARRASTPSEARRLGDRLRDEALAAWTAIDPESGLLDAGARVVSAYRDLDFSRGEVSPGVHLAKNPELGTPSGGGAEDHPTFLRALAAFNPGVHAARSSSAEHGPKYPIQSFSASRAGQHFPRVAPVMAVRIGNATVVTVPAEVTTTVGLTIRRRVQAVAALAGRGADPVVVVGLTNEYLQYIASQEEYAVQHYEGASTLYGEHSAAFVTARIEELAQYVWKTSATPAAQSASALQEVSYWRPTFHFPVLAGVSSSASDDASVSAPALASTVYGEAALASTLTGVSPRDVLAPEHFGVALLHDDTVIADERGADVRIGWNDARATWRLQWAPRDGAIAAACGIPLRWRVRIASRALLFSPSSTLPCPAMPSARTEP